MRGTRATLGRPPSSQAGRTNHSHERTPKPQVGPGSSLVARSPEVPVQRRGHPGTAARPAGACQRGKWSSGTGLTLRFSFVTIAATLEQGWSSPPCPPRARSTGIWRSLTVNNGRQHAALTCAIGIASAPEDGTGRAFQARDRQGHIGAKSGPRTTRAQRTTTVISGPSSAQLIGQIWADAAGPRGPPGLSDRE
jgi:hypothetical protein